MIFRACIDERQLPWSSEAHIELSVAEKSSVSSYLGAPAISIRQGHTCRHGVRRIPVRITPAVC